MQKYLHTLSGGVTDTLASKDGLVLKNSGEGKNKRGWAVWRGGKREILCSSSGMGQTIHVMQYYY